MGCVPVKDQDKSKGKPSEAPPRDQQPSSANNPLKPPEPAAPKPAAKQNFEAEYQFLEEIEHGQRFSVWKVKHLSTGDVRAAKVMTKNKTRDQDEDEDEFEGQSQLKGPEKADLQALIELDSPHISRVFEFFEDPKRFIIVCELMNGGSLLEYIGTQPRSKFSERFVADLLHQVLLGLNYFHKKNMIHRDVKMENLIFSDPECKQLKLSGFEVAHLKKERTEGQRRDLIGNPLYAAPEIVASKPYDEKCDVWSLGVLSYIVLSGKAPFDVEKGMPEILQQINDKVFTIHEFSSEEWAGVSDYAKDFILRMLTRHAPSRATANELLHHPWLQQAKDEEPDPAYAQKAMGSLKLFTGQQRFEQAIAEFVAFQADFSSDKQRLTSLFEKMDKDGNQTLSKEELEQGLKESGVIMTPERFDQLFASLDREGKGAVNYSAFMAAASDMSQLFTEKRLRAAFDFFDHDKNGSIDKNELATVLRRGQISEAQIAAEFKSFDTNQDGKISFEEFQEFIKKSSLVKAA